MYSELKAAVDWILALVTARSNFIYDPEGDYVGEPLYFEISFRQLAKFEVQLIKILADSFAKHWCVREPTLKQALRVIHVSPQFPVNEFIKKAADLVGIRYEALAIHDMTFTIWIDPGVVTTRFNDEDPMYKVYHRYRH